MLGGERVARHRRRGAKEGCSPEVGSFAKFERAMTRECTVVGLAAAKTEGRMGRRRPKLNATKRREIAESVLTGRKTGAEMTRLYGISQPTVSRIVAEHRAASP